MKERSIFWPLVMIATGVVWLMIGMGRVPQANLWALVYIFPFLLIALGVGLILRAFWRFTGMLVSLLVVAGAVMAIFYAPQFGWDHAPNWASWNFGPNLGGSVSGSGMIKTETRDLPDLESVFVEYPAEVTIRQGEKQSLTITADDNLLPQISTEVQDGKLIIKNSERNWNQRVRSSEPMQIVVTVRELNEVAFSSAGKLKIEGLESDSLTVTVSGAGDVILTGIEVGQLKCTLSGAGNINADGSADKINIRISGFGSLDSSKLQAQDAEINISGAGNATLRAEQTLDANISGAGSIVYYGNPQVIKTVSGAGSVIKAGE